MGRTQFLIFLTHHQIFTGQVKGLKYFTHQFGLKNNFFNLKLTLNTIS